MSRAFVALAASALLVIVPLALFLRRNRAAADEEALAAADKEKARAAADKEKAAFKGTIKAQIRNVMVDAAHDG